MRRTFGWTATLLLAACGGGGGDGSAGAGGTVGVAGSSSGGTGGATTGGTGGAGATGGTGAATGGTAGSGATGGTSGTGGSAAGGTAGSGGLAGSSGTAGAGGTGASAGSGGASGGAGTGGLAGGSGMAGMAGASNPCADVTCDSPPAETCADASTLRRSVVPGTCSAGTCTYDPLLVPCTHGCASGDCNCEETPTLVDTVSPAASDMAIDSEGGLHVVYWRSGAGLGYAHRPAGGTWTTGDVDAAANVGWFPSIAIDGDDTVHVSYAVVTVGGLEYASKAKGASTFSTEHADATAGYGLHSSIAVDANGVVRIAHYDDTADDLLMSSRGPSASTFTTIRVDAAGDVGQRASIAIDDSRGVHIVYADGTNEKIRYARRPPEGSFTSSDVDAMRWGTDNSLVVDADGNLHVSYYDNTSFNGTLRYAFLGNGGGGWQLDSIDATTRTGFANSMGIAPDGTLHAVHYHQTDQDLRYSVRPPAGSWTSRALATTGIVGENPSLVVDGAGVVHIVYGDREGGNALRYRHICP